MLGTSAQDEARGDGPAAGDRYDGIYLGFVRDSFDPLRLGRIRVYCPEVMGNEDAPRRWSTWAEPGGAAASGFDQGLLMVPPDPSWARRDPGAPGSPLNETRVWVEFRNGDPSRPVYSLGGPWYGDQDLPLHTPVLGDSNRGGDESIAKPNFTSTTTKKVVDREDFSVSSLGAVTEAQPATQAQYPFNWILKTPAGHVVEFDNTPNVERFRLYHPAGTSIEINAAGTKSEKIAGKYTRFISNDSIRVYKGADTQILEGARHYQVAGSSVEIFTSSRLEVVEQAYDSSYKSRRKSVIGGEWSVVSGNISFESRGAVSIVAADEFGVGANDISMTAAQNTEISGTTTTVRSTTGVKLEGLLSAPANPIYASSAIDIGWRAAINTYKFEMSAQLTSLAALGDAPVPGALLTKVIESQVRFEIILEALFANNTTVHTATTT